MAYPIVDKEQLLFALNTSAKRFRELGVKRLGFQGAFAPDTEKTSELIDYYVELENDQDHKEVHPKLTHLLEEISCRKAALHDPAAFNERFNKDQIHYADLGNIKPKP
jgi:hypothetical protein